jgi:hypothetical protein
VLLAALADNHPEALWEFLPPTYRADLNELLHFAAQRMDPEIWSAAMRLARKLGALPRSPHADWGAGDAANERRHDVQVIAGILSLVAESDLAKLEYLKRLDLGAWLKDAGPQLFAELAQASRGAPNAPWAAALDQLGKLEVEAVSLERDSALVRFSTEGLPPVELPYRRVEGKWIPQGLADGWIEAIGQAKARLAVALGEEHAAQARARWLAALGRAERHVDRLSAAKSAAEFRLLLEEGAPDLAALAALVGAAPTAAVSADQQAGEAAAVPLVRVVIAEPLSQDALAALVSRLRDLLDQSHEPVVETSISDTETAVTVGPVADLEAMLRRLDFLEDPRLDAGSRTIRAERMPRK